VNYYFPSILPDLSLKKINSIIYDTVNSGENGIRLLLRQLNLPAKSKVAVPIFVCDSLKNAILKENLLPFYLDLKNDQTFWADYKFVFNFSEVGAIILVHLYGFIHPDTNEIMALAKQKNIPLIHDAAQSFGIYENALTYSNGIVYSFGPGKSSTAAGGAIIKSIEKDFYKSNCRATNNFLQTLKAKFFLKSRIYNYHFSIIDKITYRFINKIKYKDEIAGMTTFQKMAASNAIILVDESKQTRRNNYQIIKNSIENNVQLSIAFDDNKGLYFKIILRVENKVTLFKKYLEQNLIPYFNLYNSLVIDKIIFNLYPQFSKNASSFIEISTEASIPTKEIERIAFVLKKYASN